MESEEAKDGLVLVGFGDQHLADMLPWIGTDKEDDLLSAFTKAPPVYRSEVACSNEDIQNACRFLAFIHDSIMEYEQHMNPQGDEENTDESSIKTD